MKRTFGPVVGFLILASSPWLAWAVDPPDSQLNPSTGHIESVDAPGETDYHARHVEDPGQGRSQTVTSLSTHPAENPRIVIDDNGKTWVVWWEDAAVDRIYRVARETATGTWSSEKVISDPLQESQHPEIVHSGSIVWVAYQVVDGSNTSIVALDIVDGSEPFSAPAVIATTSFTGDVDVVIHSESGHVWATWVDSSDDVGWSEYDMTSELWELEQFEDYSTSDIGKAREMIRTTVLGL